MKKKTFRAVEFKRRLQKEAERRLARLSEKDQLRLLHEKYGHLTMKKKKPRSA
jgi:hypothetical protein